MASADVISFFKQETETEPGQLSAYRIFRFRSDYPEAWEFLMHSCTVKFEVTVVIDVVFPSLSFMLGELGERVGWLIVTETSFLEESEYDYELMMAQFGLVKREYGPTISYFLVEGGDRIDLI